MAIRLSKRQLLKKYKEVLSEYKSETVFENFCARTLTLLPLLEKEIAQRRYRRIAVVNEKPYSSSSV